MLGVVEACAATGRGERFIQGAIEGTVGSGGEDGLGLAQIDGDEKLGAAVAAVDAEEEHVGVAAAAAAAAAAVREQRWKRDQGGNLEGSSQGVHRGQGYRTTRLVTRGNLKTGGNVL